MKYTRDLLAAAFLAGCVGLALGMMFGIGIGEYGTRQEAIDHGAARYTCDAHGKVTFEWLGKE